MLTLYCSAGSPDLNPSTIDELGKWGLKKVEPRNKQSWTCRVWTMITLWAATTRHHHTKNWWKLKYLPHTCHAIKDGLGGGKISENCPVARNKCRIRKTRHLKQSCKKMSAPACKPRPPHIPILGENLLANIVSCLTYPKLHLEPHLKDYNFSFLYTVAISELVHSQQQSTAPNIVPWVGWIHFLLCVLPGTNILTQSTGAQFSRPI